MNNKALAAAYTRAKGFLLDKKRELINVRGWNVQPEDDDVRNDQ